MPKTLRISPPQNASQKPGGERKDEGIATGLGQLPYPLNIFGGGVYDGLTHPSALAESLFVP